jgi:hypothetical protein
MNLALQAVPQKKAPDFYKLEKNCSIMLLGSFWDS